MALSKRSCRRCHQKTEGQLPLCRSCGKDRTAHDREQMRQTDRFNAALVRGRSRRTKSE